MLSKFFKASPQLKPLKVVSKHGDSAKKLCCLSKQVQKLVHKSCTFSEKIPKIDKKYNIIKDDLGI